MFAFVCHHLHATAAFARGVLPAGRVPHRFVPSTRNRIERMWAEVNLRVNLAMKLVLLTMERNGELDIGIAHHIGALQVLLPPVLQHACDILVVSYNRAHHRSARGHGGRPDSLWQQFPPPAGSRLTIPPGYDAVAEYEQANNKTVEVRPRWVALRDPFFGQQNKQVQRLNMVMQMWGSVADAWHDIQHQGGRQLFIPSFRAFLQFQ